MIKPADLPETLSVFPLPGALLLPRSRLPLQIFEPRYLQMVEDSLKTRNRLIGMIQPDPSDPEALQQVGCAGRIVQFSETEDGRLMIVLAGISRFRIIEEKDGFRPYRRCDVDWSAFPQDLGKTSDKFDFDRGPFLELLDRYFTALQLSADLDTIKQTEDEMLINSLSMLLDFRPEDKQALLESPTLEIRSKTLTTLIEFAMRGGSDEETMQ
ncbi:MAG: LON peptidase substrate-binding domain-containing protein [Rhodobacteraceae bacterium]|nr:LON peptidase substrate-binding domain-containing protein [Paracoccaceae bacterium]